MPCTVNGMARLKTKGDTITLRLPLDIDARVRARATELGLEPGPYIAASIVASLTAKPK